jgi:bacteriocin-like protein
MNIREKSEIREPSRELTEKELAHVSGGIIAVLVGGPPTDAVSPFYVRGQCTK